ncbi:MAG: metal ABC transporter solute-binding protein, Zn/Mn family [Phycisphaerales bacterium JB043]
MRLSHSVLVLLLSLACALGARAQERLSIVCTISQVGDAVAQIGGDRADVVTLMGQGVDPHLYKPTRSDMVAMRRADIVFANGLLLEGKMTDALLRLREAGKPVVFVAESVDAEHLLHPEYFEGASDPHVWMDPGLWAECVEAIASALAEQDPGHASEYEANARAYIERVRELDAYAERVMSTVADDMRVLITAHDAFNYFGRRFGLEVMGIQGISTESEAGVREIEQLVDVLVERNIPAVFMESTVSERNVRALIAGARARGHSVSLGASLFSDAMGAPGTYEGTYIGMLDHNVTSIVRALGGEAPSGGMHGRLAMDGGD